MEGGFNTNVRYRGRTFHVQTEDSGRKRPKIITLLYEGGVILFSKKTSYAEHVDADNVQEVVRELMESQHREMLVGLKSGAFDEKVGLEASRGSKAGARAAAAVTMEFGEGVIGSASLDDLILQHLAAS